MGHALLQLEFSGPEATLCLLANEAGGHRLQRVPPSERRGRVHSSTVTVAVLDSTEPLATKAASPYLQRSAQDFALSWFSGQGKGGQNRNKVQACLRLKHLPSGLVKTAQSRSRGTSYQQAMGALLVELDRRHVAGIALQVNTLRHRQIGSGQRTDKRRTWRFQDNQVIDHLTGKTARCSDVLKGHFAKLWN